MANAARLAGKRGILEECDMCVVRYNVDANSSTACVAQPGGLVPSELGLECYMEQEDRDGPFDTTANREKRTITFTLSGAAVLGIKELAEIGRASTFRSQKTG